MDNEIFLAGNSGKPVEPYSLEYPFLASSRGTSEMAVAIWREKPVDLASGKRLHNELENHQAINGKIHYK